MSKRMIRRSAGAAGVLIALVAAGLSSVPAVAATGSWSTRASSGFKRQEVAYVQVGGKLYLAGGKSNVQQVYDPATNAWANVAPLPAPTPLDHIQAAAVGGRIYYIGGLTSYPGPSVGSVYIYDPASNTFTTGAPMPAGRDRGAGGVAVYDGKVYIAGGLHAGITVGWFDVYDPATNTWASLPDLPHRRDHFQGAVVNDRFWAIGGRVSSSSFRVGYNEAYDFATGRWVTGFAPLPTLRGGFATAVFGTEIAVIGGEGGGSTFDTVEGYNTATNTWRTLTPMPTARHGIQAAMWNGAAYIADGGLRQGGGAPTEVQEMLTVASRFQPDAQIRLSTESAYVGGNVYDASGATEVRSATAAPGTTRSFVARVQNDGNATDGFRFKGCSTGSGFTIRYFRGATGTTQVTSAVTAGTYAVSGLAPGATRALRVEITVGGGVATGAEESCLVAMTSMSSSSTTDGVVARVTAS
jgi:N-acetylneuraminic acid mutarotase